MTATWSRRGEVEKEKEDSVALDTEGQRFTQVSYRDALQRASRKVTESESKYRDDVITPESQGQNGTGRFRRRRRHQGQGRRQ